MCGAWKAHKLIRTRQTIKKPIAQASTFTWTPFKEPSQTLTLPIACRPGDRFIQASNLEQNPIFLPAQRHRHKNDCADTFEQILLGTTSAGRRPVGPPIASHCTWARRVDCFETQPDGPDYGALRPSKGVGVQPRRRGENA